LEYRVIPALLALIKRLAPYNDVQVFALRQEAEPAKWDLQGARIHNIGFRHTYLRALHEIYSAHRSSPLDLVHAIWSGPCGLVAVAAARMLRIPSVIHVAGGELVALPAIGYGGRLKWQGRAREALVLRATSAITAPSAPVIQALSALGFAAQRVPLGVDLEIWPPREPVRRDLSRPARLIHVASLNKVKDQSTLLRAVAALAASNLNFEMDIVGEDTLEGEMQAVAAQSGLSGKVRFHGFLPQRLLRPLLESAHLLVMSSRHETGPLVMLEAAVAGVPTVGTAVGHIAEWAPGAAIAVPIGDAAELASAIGRLLANEELRLQIAMCAMRRAIAEDADHTAARFQDLYAQLVARKAAS
jgi:glycosyltransferase involved in cell wall biosynthesis